MADISRRDVLRGASVAGAASVGAVTGAGAQALLRDAELFQGTSARTGTLDLQVATRTVLNGEASYAPTDSGDPFPSAFASESTVEVAYPDLDPTGKPNSGSVTLGLRVCDNPGRVWMRIRGESSALSDAIRASVSYDPTCSGEGRVLYEGSLSGVFSFFENGTRLDSACRYLGKIEAEGETLVVEYDDESGSGDSLAVEDIPGELTVPGPDGDVTVEVTGAHFTSKGELRGVDLASPDVEFCRVEVKGGGKQTDDRDGIETYQFDCASEALELVAGTTPSGEPSALSHVTMYTCDEGECLGCDPGCLTLDWRLPGAKRVAGESLAFEFDLFARQCRHEEGENPWL